MDAEIAKAKELMLQVETVLATYALDVLGAIAILIGGWIVASWVKKAVDHSLNRFPKLDPTLRPLFSSTARYLVLIVTIVAVLNQFGVETTSIIAVLGAAGLAIGLALQGTLSNVAAGAMLLMLRPFKVGDYVDAQGVAGTVVEINLFTTEFKTFDGVFVLAPNSEIWNKAITNYSRNPTRRIDVLCGISYGDDIEGALKVMAGIMESDERVLKDPAPQTMVMALGESSVDLNLRCWVPAAEYWNVLFDFTKRVKLDLEAAGHTIPFPQRDVHVIQEQAKPAAE
jgi:small conductance mechanosensitive channel